MKRPIYDMLSSYQKSQPVRLHMPGHKGSLSPMDVTEIPQSDDLNQPTGAIVRAQQLLAEAYSSDHSYLLVGGSTAGIKAMLLYAQMAKGGPIIMPRASHRSAFNACCMYAIDAVMAESSYDTGGVSYSDEASLLRAMDAYPHASAVMVTRPDYYGRCMSLEAIYKKAKGYGMLLLVDEAHGAHYAFGEELPESACGVADLWVNSAHKTLNAATSGAYLHASSTIQHHLLEEVLRTQRTSSPSFPIMMSLDDARYHAVTNRGEWDMRASACRQLEDQIDCIDGISVCDDAWAQSYGYIGKDPTRLVIDVRHKGGGFEVARKLYEAHTIQVEMADFHHITAIMTPWDHGDWDQLLLAALKALPIKAGQTSLPPWPEPSKRVMSMHEAWRQAGCWVDSRDALGHVTATALGCYPPGTPLVLPGEVIDQLVLDYLHAVEAAGGSIFGTIDNKIRMV